MKDNRFLITLPRMEMVQNSCNDFFSSSSAAETIMVIRETTATLQVLVF